MTTQVQVRGAATATQEARTLAAREVDIDTTLGRINVHNGSTAGGIKHARAADIQLNSFTYAAGSGTNAITATFAPVPAALIAGMSFRVKIANDNTGAVTFNPNSLGATACRKVSGGVLVALEAGDLIAGVVYDFLYDGTYFQVGLAGGSGDKLIHAESISGAPQTVDFEDFFTAGNSYRFDLSNVEADGNSDLLMRLGTSGASWVTSGYAFVSITHNGSGTVAAESSSGGSNFNLCPTQITANEKFNGSIWVYDPRAAVGFPGVRASLGFRANGTSIIQQTNMSGEQRNSTAALASLQLDLESTNTFGGGLVSVYEIPNV